MEILDRDISWLSFNSRVLDETHKNKNSLADKVMFHGIVHSNLAEHISVRYPSAITEGADIDLLSAAIISHYDAAVKDFKSFNKKHQLIRSVAALKRDAGFLKDYFKNNVFPALIPITVDSARKANIHEGVYVMVITEDDGKEILNYIEIPSHLDRFIQIRNSPYVVTIEDLIQENLKSIIKGRKIKWSCPFSLLRSAEIYIQSDQYTDPYTAIQKTLSEREKSWITRVELGKHGDMYKAKIGELVQLDENTLICTTSIIQLSDLKDFPQGVFGTKEQAWKMTPIVTFPKDISTFKYISKGDVLCFHPYESYDGSFVRFLEEAAEDKDVVSIRICLYRVSDRSRIIDALLKAADNGKLVVVLVELKARFDEKHNIHIANILKEGGVRIVYTKPDIKTHAKVCLVSRREGASLYVYSHVGTGNYSEKNARLYTDYSYFTKNAEIGTDLTKFFNLLTSDQDDFKSRQIIYAPYNLKDTIVSLIEGQIKLAKKRKPARITVKCNAITDPGVSKKLIEAADSGVKVTLIVRSACVIQPQKNIKIYSIVGHLLEHSRIFIAGNAVLIGSSDLMTRNLSRRNELMIRVKNKSLRNRILKHVSWYLKDTVNRRRIQTNYAYYNVTGKKVFDSQQAAYEEAKGLKT